MSSAEAVAAAVDCIARSGAAAAEPEPYRTALAESIVEAVRPYLAGSADDKLRPGQTVKEATDRCIEIVRGRQRLLTSNDNGAAAREYALAITALEDAQMRYTRGRAMHLGKFAPADLDAD